VETAAADGKTLGGVHIVHLFAQECAAVEEVPAEPDAVRAWIERLASRFPGFKVLTAGPVSGHCGKSAGQNQHRQLRPPDYGHGRVERREVRASTAIFRACGRIGWCS
jgi:hypothetical protein